MEPGLYYLRNVNDQLPFIAEKVCLLHVSCVSVKIKRIKPKQLMRFNTEIRALIE